MVYMTYYYRCDIHIYIYIYLTPKAHPSSRNNFFNVLTGPIFVLNILEYVRNAEGRGQYSTDNAYDDERIDRD